jgi:hypothetical protein
MKRPYETIMLLKAAPMSERRSLPDSQSATNDSII